MSLRSKRLTSSLDPEAAQFLDSTTEDAQLVQDDILGSLAHVQTLFEAKVLGPTEANQLTGALVRLHAEAAKGSFSLSSDLEDVHMNVEAKLSEQLGDVGKKLHTARSRNDQVALDLRLAARRRLLQLAHETGRLVETLLQLADQHGDAILPGYTHFQVAQPVTLGHHLGAHAERFTRDAERLLDAYKRVNVSPLGAAALAGTRYPINPATTAKLLAFDAPFNNSLDAVSDRDFVAEVLFAETLLLTHVSGLAEELILFTNPAFGFAEIGDAHATGSSIMPQKKNPDVLEVARAKAGTLLGTLTATLSQLKALPLAYNRDLQETKRLFLTSSHEALSTIHNVANLLTGLSFHPDAMTKAAAQGYSDATEVADYLVARGVPFREAHAQAAELVRKAVELSQPLSGLPLATFQKVNGRIGKDLFAYLGPQASVASKTSPGGAAPAASAASRRALQRKLTQLQSQFSKLESAVKKAETNLLQTTKEVKTQ